MTIENEAKTSKKWTKFVYIGVFAAILVACVVYWNGGFEGKSEQATRRVAPEFSLKDHSGQVHTLAEARGKLAIVHFWASWCPPCLQETPELLEFAKQYQDKNLEIFAVSLDDKWEDAEKILNSKTLPKNMISVLDVSTKVPESYGSYQYPETYLIDGDGKVIIKWVGGQPWSSPGLTKVIDEVLSKVSSRS
jgi:cytochrome c biogenesis protein CcmG/thiol:disulfide interchange protein DsbE